MVARRIPTETLVELHQRLGRLPPRSAERRALLQETAQLYGVSEQTMYRVLQEHTSLRSSRRADYGKPRVMPKATLERYCEVIAALMVRTSNGKGHNDAYKY